MAKPRTPIGPTDHALAKLHEAICAPHRFALIKHDASLWIQKIYNTAHREFLEGKLHEIEEAGSSLHKLQKIQNEIDDWNDRKFPPGLRKS